LHGAVVRVEILRPATECGTQNPRFAQNDRLKTKSKEQARCRRYKRKFKNAGRRPAVQKIKATASGLKT
jgi:hypothetical protein